MHEKSSIVMLALILMCFAPVTQAQQPPTQKPDPALSQEVRSGHPGSSQELDIGVGPKLSGGQERWWRLRSGHFDDDSPATRLQPGQDDGPLDTYSGIRLGLPLGGKR